MDITLDKNDDQLSAILTVHLTEADYGQGVDEKIKDYTKKAQIKGFRPGKVPAALVRKMYGKSLLVEEINGLLGKSVDAYIKDNNIKILGEPLPVDSTVNFDTDKDFDFKFELGLLPDFELPADQGLTVNRHQVSIDDSTLQETYDQISRQFGQSTNPDASEAGDYLYGKLKKADSDTEQTVLLPISKVKNGTEKFVGVKPGDTVTFDLQDAFGGDVSAIANFSGMSKDAAGAATGEYVLSVEKINRTDKPELDQELFDKVFGKDIVTSKEEFDEKVRATIQENYDREAEGLLNRQIIDQMVDATTISVPTEFFKKWLLRANQGKLTAEQVEEHYNDYERELKWSMIRNKVVEDQGLKVSNEEIVERTMDKIMGQFNLPEVNEELRESVRSFADNYLKQENGKNYVSEYEAILAEKVLENLRGKVVVTDNPISAEDFRSQNAG